MQYNLIRSSPIKNSFRESKEGVLKMKKHSFYKRNLLTMSRQGVGYVYY